MLRKTTVAGATALLLLGGTALPAFAASGATGRTGASAPHAAGTAEAGHLDDTVVDVTADNYDQVMEMSQEKPVVLDFTADWCGWCQKQKPYLQKFHDEDGGSWIWARVDVDVNPDITKQWNVSGIPALLNIQKGEEAGSRQVGFDGPEPLRQWLDAL